MRRHRDRRHVREPQRRPRRGPADAGPRPRRSRVPRPLPEPRPALPPGRRQARAAPAVPPAAGTARIRTPRPACPTRSRGHPWKVPEELRRRPARSRQWTSGRQALSQENYDGEDSNWLGNIFTGGLPTSLPLRRGPQHAERPPRRCFAAVEQVFYAPPHMRKIVQDKAIKVGDKDAWLLSSSWTSPRSPRPTAGSGRRNGAPS